MQNRTFRVTITPDQEEQFRKACEQSKPLKRRMAFSKKVGMMNSPELFYMGICCDSLCGFFLAKRLQELQDFCKKNPYCHIGSYINNMYINRIVPGARIFFLADGDNDPNLQVASTVVYYD